MDEQEAYLLQHVSPEDAVLSWIERQTHLRMVHPRMLSGAVQGRFLTMISQMLKPSCIVEIGTFTGYSALCLAKGLAEGGFLHTIEHDDELEDLIREALAMAGCSQQVVLHIGEALQLIPQIPGPYDLVFIDGDKREYTAYYEAVLPRLRSGGYILADNVLWDGKVLDASLCTDAQSKAIAAFNQQVQSDPRVENVLLPLRDGLMMIRKK
jgi:Predicted O-methyltransferase